MKAALYPGNGEPMRIEAMPDPEPGDGDVIIKVARCGICGTDLHMTEGHQWQFAAGTVPGHEYAGEVVAVGRSVTSLNIGDRITALPSTGCGHCVACDAGNYPLCQASPGVMGGFAEYARIPAQVAVKLPATLTMTDGALLEPLAVGRYGVRISSFKPGDHVLVLGAGSVALCAIWWARRMGAGRIAVVSRSERRREAVMAMGADAYVLSGEDEAAAVIAALGRAPDVVFDCIGSPGIIGRAIGHARTLGQVVSLGFCTAPDTIVPAVAGYKGVSLVFPVGYALTDFEEAAREMDKGRLEHSLADPAHMVSSTIALDDLPSMFATLRGANGETKVHVACS